MKKLTLILTLIIAFATASFESKAQKFPAMDVSPADISYLKTDGPNVLPIAKIIYGRPAKKGRTMLGGKEPFGKVWRLGANETTEIKLFKDVTFGGKLLKSGTYSLYAIPNATKWTIIFNSKLDTWGAYEYDDKQDVVRFNVPVGVPTAEVEFFSIIFDAKAGSGNLIMAWENTLVKIPIKY